MKWLIKKSSKQSTTRQKKSVIETKSSYHTGNGNTRRVYYFNGDIS